MTVLTCYEKREESAEEDKHFNVKGNRDIYIYNLSEKKYLKVDFET